MCFFRTFLPLPRGKSERRENEGVSREKSRERKPLQEAEAAFASRQISDQLMGEPDDHFQLRLAISRGGYVSGYFLNRQMSIMTSGSAPFWF